MEQLENKIISISEANKGQKKPRRHPVRNALFALFCLLVIAGVICFVVFRNQLTSNTFADLLSRLRFSLGSGEETVADTFAYDDFMLSQYNVFQNGLILLSDHRLAVFSSAGKEKYGVDCSFARPALAVSDRMALAYDRGGKSYLLIDNSSTLRAEEWSDIIYTACMNKKGAYALVSRERGYASTVHVFDDRQKMQFTWYSARMYITDVALSPSSKLLAVISGGQRNNQFYGHVTLLNTGKEEPIMSVDLPDILPLGVGFLGEKLFYVVTEESLLIYNESGEQQYDFSFDGRPLLAYDASSEGYVVLCLAGAGQTSTGELIAIDREGPRARLAIMGEFTSLSVADKHVGLLVDGVVSAYDADLKSIGQPLAAADARALLMRQDGSALVLSANGTSIYRP